MAMNSFFLFIGGLGGTEVVIIIIAFLLLFGAKRIPELAKGLGRGIREFKDASKEIKHDLENAAADNRQPEQPKAQQPNQN